MALQNIGLKSAAGAAIIGLGALVAGCSRDAANTASAANTAAAPVTVTCEPNQRAVVRQVPVNGALQSQVQCESVVPGAVAGTFGAAAPLNYATGAPAAMPVGYTTYAPIAATEPTRIVRTAYPRQVVTREVAPRRVSYQPVERVYRPKRSVKKSAVIIGSSAGVGAGIGAAMGGKKGAGIGALIGGGSAAIWDQITRRK
ncbi:MAG TPA: hypothetical protein VEL51_06755 [Vicinamibacterales bacterium]|nr:hypothetical protein [Vicinamibacterales bacterium]